MKNKNFIVRLEEEKDGGFSVSVPSLPGCFSQGDTYEQAIENIQEAIQLYFEDAEIPQRSAKELIVSVALSQ